MWRAIGLFFMIHNNQQRFGKPLAYTYFYCLSEDNLMMDCLPVRPTNVFGPGPHLMGLGYARKRRLPSFPGLPQIY